MMNQWPITNWQDNYHMQALSLIWIHRKVSELMHGDQEVQYKMGSIKWNSTQDESMECIKLTNQFQQAILEFDMDLYKIICMIFMHAFYSSYMFN